MAKQQGRLAQSRPAEVRLPRPPMREVSLLGPLTLVEQDAPLPFDGRETPQQMIDVDGVAVGHDAQDQADVALVAEVPLELGSVEVGEQFKGDVPPAADV
jgi:hypothetical protein